MINQTANAHLDMYVHSSVYLYTMGSLIDLGAPSPFPHPLAPLAANKAGISINTVQFRSSWCLKLCLANVWLNDLKFPRVLL